METPNSVKVIYFNKDKEFQEYSIEAVNSDRVEQRGWHQVEFNVKSPLSRKKAEVLAEFLLTFLEEQRFTSMDEPVFTSPIYIPVRYLSQEGYKSLEGRFINSCRANMEIKL